MEQTKYTCKDCVLLNDEDSEFPYCLGKDLYTDANPDDDACGDIIPLVYTCKDCLFFKNDICHNTTEKRYTSEENPSCRDFEYKTFVEQKINI